MSRTIEAGPTRMSPAYVVLAISLAVAGCGRFGFQRDEQLCLGCDGGSLPAFDAGPLGGDGSAALDAPHLDAPRGDGELSLDGATDAGLPMTTVVVEPVYPLAGAQWNDYVARSVATEDGAHQPDVACAGTEMMRRACVHGGERKLVRLVGATTCEGVVIADELYAFTWRCAMEAGVPVAYSIGLGERVGLAHLIDWTSLTLRPNRIRVTSPEGEWRSDPAVWWTNPVMEAPANSAMGAAPVDLPAGGAAAPIYVVSASRASSGYRMASPKLSFVVGPGATLSYNGTGTATCDAGMHVCLVVATADFAWVEGAFSTLSTAGYAHRLVSLEGVHSGTVRLVRAFGGVGDAATQGSVHLEDSHACRLSHVSVRRMNDIGIRLSGSHYNDVYDSRASGRMTYAANTTREGGWNHFRRLHLSGYTNLGAWLYSNSAILAEFAGVNGYGSALAGNGASVTTHATSSNSNSDGFTSRRGHAFINTASINHTESGFYTTAAPANVLVDLAAGANGEYGYEFNDGGAAFSGSFVAGANTLGACIELVGGPVDATCAPVTGTWPMVSRPTDYSAVFVGVVTADSVNGSERATPLAPAMIADADWLDFEHWLRNFAAAGPELSVMARGPCETSPSCMVRDYRLRSSDTVLRAVHGTPLDGAPCPASVDGNGDAPSGTVLTYSFLRDNPGDGDGACESGEPCVSVPQRFLANALEILSDDVGDDDSLCESGERCIFSPNIGAYQGEGDFEAHTCVFQSGPPSTGIADVEMHFYPINGV